MHAFLDKYLHLLHNEDGLEVQIMNELKRERIEKKLTQKEAADRIGVSLRSYIDYENNAEKEGTTKYRFLLSELSKINPIDENHGILSISDIQNICNSVFSDYAVDFCYLFGSYAKGRATPSSDVDLVISSDITGLRFYEIAERLRESLHKRVDLLDIKQLINNEELLKEVLKEGTRIYG